MSILIVEDNPINALVLENFLAKGGYNTTVAKNAQEALACLPQIKDLQLIITDLSMPEMGGLELITHLRRTPAMKGLPVIIVTGYANAEHRLTSERACMRRVSRQTHRQNPTAEPSGVAVKRAPSRLAHSTTHAPYHGDRDT